MASIKQFLFGKSHPSDYEVGVFVFLSTFRFFGFALATAIIFTIPHRPIFDWMQIIITGLLGLYTIFKVLFRFRHFATISLTYTILVFDLAICVASVLLTGGVNSPFIFYSLAPVLTAALFFQRRVTLAVAVVTTLNVILANTGLANISSNFPLLLESEHFTVVLLYTVFCFTVATLSYHSNVNVFRHAQFEAMLMERQRMRREIHDGIAQVLGYLKTKINLARTDPSVSNKKLFTELDDIYNVISESYDDIRDMVDFLDTGAVVLSLDAALSDHIKRVQKRMNCSIEFAAPPKLPKLSAVTTIQLLRIGQEALNNARKHASATQVWVRLQNTPRGLELAVKDNGVGFSPGERKGSGLAIMRERVDSIDAILSVTSSPGEGTEVIVTLPRDGMMI